LWLEENGNGEWVIIEEAKNEGKRNWKSKPPATVPSIRDKSTIGFGHTNERRKKSRILLEGRVAFGPYSPVKLSNWDS